MTLPIPFEMIERASNMPVFLLFVLEPGDYWSTPRLAIADGEETVARTALDKVKGIDIDAYIGLEIFSIMDWLFSFPNVLQRLRLTGVGTYMWPSPLTDDRTSSWLRKLTRLHVTLTNPHDTDDILHARGWDNLVSLTLENSGVLDLVPIMANFPHLEELFLLSAMSIAQNIDRAGGLQRPVVQTNLLRLSVTIRDRWRVAELFEGITLPALQRLGICAEASDWMHAGAPILDALLDRSRCPLGSLVLSSLYAPFTPDMRELGEQLGARWGIPDIRFYSGGVEREETRYFKECKIGWYS